MIPSSPPPSPDPLPLPPSFSSHIDVSGSASSTLLFLPSSQFAGALFVAQYKSKQSFFPFLAVRELLVLLSLLGQRRTKENKDQLDDVYYAFYLPPFPSSPCPSSSPTSIHIS